MIPVRLKLLNFTSYKDAPELNFSKFHLAAISGPNGAGKSSLLDAITWCVWGWSRAGDLADQLVHKGTKHMFVELTFQLDSQEFTVKRERNLTGGSSTNLELWSGNHNLTEGTIKMTQEKIINLLHLTFETFINSSFLRQGHADEFTTKGPTDRKRILADILGLSHYDELEEKAKEKIKDIQTKLKLLEYQILEIEAEISMKGDREKTLTESKQKVFEIEKTVRRVEEELMLLQRRREVLILASEQHQKLEQNLNAQLMELSEIVTKGKQRANRIKGLEQKILSLESVDQKIKELKNLEQEVEILNKKNQEKLELEKQLAQIAGVLNVKEEQKKNLQKIIEDLKKQLNQLSIPAAKCPTCGQEIGKDQKHQVRQELEKKLNDRVSEVNKISIKDEQIQIQNLNQRIIALKIDDSKLIKLQKDLQNLEILQKQKEEFLQNQASLETEKKTREELLSLYNNKKTQVDKLRSELEKLPKVSQNLLKIQADLESKENSLQTLRVTEKEAQTILGQAKELISRSEQLEKLAKQKKDEQTSLQKDKAAYDELALAFGKKGIQAMIIETAIPEIEDEANRLLEKLTDGRMKIELQTQRETKTKLETGEKGIIETLDIIISDEMGERPYELYSGGETFRVNFALRIALSKLLTKRAGARLQFLVIDEGFGTQDVEGRNRIVEVLDAIKNDFEKILVITHLEELKEEFPIRIEVSKGISGSTFEVVGV
ncbi:SMC family ATPase [Candidatus Daviesbacteria bacterium]|nr:SMC family ATPase [Candidatus Daviesbacteria bacterium]